MSDGRVRRLLRLRQETAAHLRRVGIKRITFTPARSDKLIAAACEEVDACGGSENHARGQERRAESRRWHWRRSR